MAKTVFRPFEVVLSNQRVDIAPPDAFPEPVSLQAAEPAAVEAETAVEEYSGPTADDIRREAESFRAKWDAEREALENSAKEAAEKIIKEAEETAFREVKRRTDEVQALKRQAEEEAEKITAEAREKAAQWETETKAALEAERKEAEEKARASGREEGFAEGKAEAERLVQRTQTVLERAQDKRADILADTEQEIIDLVLLIARKVVKVISENQRTVIVQNVAQALKKVKARGNIIIKVNTADLQLTTEHTKDFIKLLEGAAAIQVVEDSSVDSGGCIIETDFGEIDARISSQLAELENKIADLSPLKARPKAAAPAAPSPAAAPKEA
ncbi:MAG: flagellar assembly protein FliH [Treponematales bacterium]